MNFGEWCLIFIGAGMLAAIVTLVLMLCDVISNDYIPIICLCAAVAGLVALLIWAIVNGIPLGNGSSNGPIIIPMPNGPLIFP